MGRPFKFDAREQRITFRVSIAELERIMRHARTEGLTLADFARRQSLKRRSGRVAQAQPFHLDPDMLHQVRKIGVNLNQIAHRLNATNQFQPLELTETLTQVRALLNAAIAKRSRGSVR